MKGRTHPIKGAGPSPRYETSDAPDMALPVYCVQPGASSLFCSPCPPAERLMS